MIHLFGTRPVQRFSISQPPALGLRFGNTIDAEDKIPQTPTDVFVSQAPSAAVFSCPFRS